MSKAPIHIREITAADDPEIAKVIRSVLVEMGAPKVGTAYEDNALDQMTITYDKPRHTYFVVVENNEVIGGAGIAPLGNASEDICELQKMYFLPQARGRGVGEKMITQCLEKAKHFGFQKCYLETLPYMTAATKLYEHTGFQYLEGPIGDTGHYSCNVWMIKTL